MLVRCAILAGVILSNQAIAQVHVNAVVEPSHGTVNIILASGSNLVAITDSMLTFEDGTHKPGFKKLFKIDDRTICTVAGYYSRPGPNGIGSLATLDPQIMSEFIDHLKRPIDLDFATKVSSLESFFQFQLASNLQALVATDPSFHVENLQPLELTLAGYDLDKSLKVADITLYPVRGRSGIEFASRGRPHSSVSPSCEGAGSSEPISEAFSKHEAIPPKIRKVSTALFCDIAGLPTVAEEALMSPDIYPKDTILQVYSKANRDGTVLTLDQMRELGIELEKLTAEHPEPHEEGAVGGEAQVAWLTDGSVHEGFHYDLLPNPQVGSDLSAGKVTGGNPYDCSESHFQYAVFTDGKPVAGVIHAFARRGAQLTAELSNCWQDIDGLLFHDSSFSNGQIYYQGTEPVIFDRTNQLVNTSLELGPNVDLNKPAVHDLMCGFPWKAIHQGERELKNMCVAASPTP